MTLRLCLMWATPGYGWEELAFEELEKSKSEGPSKENREIIEFLARPGLEVITDTILGIAIE